jgi:hypothetical protein
MTPAETQSMALARPKVDGGPETAVICLLK